MLDKRLSSWTGGTVLHLVPARGRVIELESDHRFWLKRKHDTLTGIIYRIFEENIRFKYFKNCRQIDDNLRSLIVRKALEQRAAQPEGLACFNRLVQDHGDDFPGIFRSISAFFSQLKQNNYQDRFVNDLQARIIRAEEARGKSGEESFALESDLVWIFGDYEEIKRDIGVYDTDDILCSVKEYLSSNPSSPLRETDAIIFDGFIHVSRIEEDILYYLFRSVKEVWWLLDYDGQRDDPAKDFIGSCAVCKDNPGSGLEAYRIFAPLASFMKRLNEKGFETVTEKAGEVHFSNPFAQGLYMDGQLRDTGRNNLRIRAFPGMVEEVRGIASEIKRIIHDDGLDITRDLGGIRIIFPDLMEYSPLISEIFEEYGIPISLTSGLPLVSCPLSDIFLLIFKLPLNHLKREDIFRLFSSRLVREKVMPSPTHDNEFLSDLLGENLLIGDDVLTVKSIISDISREGPRPEMLDIRFFDMIASRCGISNLDDSPSVPGKGAATVRDYYNGILTKARGAFERGNLKREYYRFVIQRAILSDYLKPFHGLVMQDSPLAIEKTFKALLNDMGLPRHLMDISDLTESHYPGDYTRMISRDLKAYGLLTELLSLSASEIMTENQLFKPRTGRDLLTDFYRVFSVRLENSYLMDDQNPNFIRVSQWLEIRGRSFDYVFAGGLTDRNFPLREDTNFICPETCRNNFSVPDSIDMSRHLLSHLLRNCKKGTCLSYPEYADGKEARPSNVFIDMDSLMPPDSAPANGEMTPGTSSTKWGDSPYIPSVHEMLDAGINKGSHEGVTGTGPINPFKNIIIKNSHLAEGISRALRTIGSRGSLNGLFEYDGLVGKASKFKAFLDSKNDIFSASQLDTLANCPMRYLFERIYGLKAMDITGPDASPMAMGTHLHGVLRIFFKRLAERGINVSGLGLVHAFAEAMSAAEEYYRSAPFLDSIEFFEHQKQEFLSGLAPGSETSLSREGAFALLLRFEDEHFRDMIPEGLEYEFGFNSDSSPQLGRARLRGIIDRFDRDKNDKGYIHVYDYKTGRLPSARLIKKGLSFQLPVYIRAIEKCLRAAKITAALYSLKRDAFLGKGPLSQNISCNAGDAEGLDITGISLPDQYADKLLDLLEAGLFHHSADMELCTFCDFRYACHRDDRRISHLVSSGHDHGIYSGEKNIELWNTADSLISEWRKIREKMEKAFNLKTAAGRKNNYESVIAFGEKLLDGSFSAPLDRDYTDRLLKEIQDFKNRYLSAK
ncbi:MAG: PD-(D/E)XK nuclease family protein [Deltaproteobacteria bacterium]|nr:PD-(D/E)XK nuclease family protein [Deltaproteobacteria bacterium]